MENIKKIESCKNLEELISVITEIRGIQKLAAAAVSQETDFGEDVYCVFGDDAFITDEEIVRRTYRKHSVDIPMDWGIRPGPTNLIYFDGNGECWEARDALSITHGVIGVLEYYHAVVNAVVFKKRRKLYPITGNYFLVNGVSDVNDILKKVNPSAYEFGGYEEGYDGASSERLLLCPALEVLCREEYSFAEEVLYDSGPYPFLNESRRLMFDRLINYGGKTLPEIFKTDEAVYRLLKEESDLSVWDKERKQRRKK